MALIVEPADGAATCGRRRILDLQIREPARKSREFPGSKNEIERVTSNHAWSFPRRAVPTGAFRQSKKRAAAGRPFSHRAVPDDQLRWSLISLVISNIDTCFLPPKISLSLSSALIMRLFLAS